MESINASSVAESLDPRLYNQANSITQSADLLSKFLADDMRTQIFAGMSRILIGLSKATGGYVRLEPGFGFCPVLIGSDENPVPLYEIVEVIDEMIDYDNIKNEFPTLSYAQIDAAISFIRKVAQFNIRGINLDDLDDQDIVANHTLLNNLKVVSTDEEGARVLHHSQLNR